MDISAFRQDYQNTPLSKTDLDADPIQQFARWFQHCLLYTSDAADEL